MRILIVLALLAGLNPAARASLSLEPGAIPGPLPAWGEIEGIVPGLKEEIVRAVERDNS